MVLVTDNFCVQTRATGMKPHFIVYPLFLPGLCLIRTWTAPVLHFTELLPLISLIVHLRFTWIAPGLHLLWFLVIGRDCSS